MPGVSSSLGNHHVGAISELQVACRLLELGHKLAKPLFDDDGVDLIANYRTTVQVKGSRNGTSTNGGPKFHIFTTKWKFADLFVFHGISIDTAPDDFWIVPGRVVEDELSSQKRDTDCALALRRGARGRSERWEQYIDAWHLFD